MKKCAVFLALIMLVQSFAFAAPSSWAEAEVSEAVGLSLVPEDMQTDYQENCTRADFCRLAVKLVEKRQGKSAAEIFSARGESLDTAVFSDTADADIAAAYALGIVNGVGNGRFDPGGFITREQAAVMLMRASNVLGYAASGSGLYFADRDEASDWAVKGIDFVAAAGVMNGVSNNRFSPKGYYTREMSCVTVLRLYNAICAGSTAASSGMSAEEIFRKCSPAVFSVNIYDANGENTAMGSGFFIDTDGTFVTNYHVIDGAASAKIKLSDGRVAQVSGVLALSKEKDIAILKADVSGISTLVMGDSASVTSGQKVYAIGSPLGLENSISDGIVSNPYREEIGGIQITAAISSGSSGGALINQRGEVIGVTFAGIEEGQSLNFAVPINEVKALERTAAVPFTQAFSAQVQKHAGMFEDIYRENEPNDSSAAADVLKNGYSVTGSITGKTMDVFRINCPSSGTARVYLVSDSFFATDLLLAASPVGKVDRESIVYARGGYAENGMYCLVLEYPVSAAGEHDVYVMSQKLAEYGRVNIEYMFYYEFIAK